MQITNKNSINPVNKTNNNLTTQPKVQENLISPSEAMSIAASNNPVSGATPGTPKLVTQNGNQIYIVPLIDQGKTVGEIDVDAVTGQNLGGSDTSS